MNFVAVAPPLQSETSKQIDYTIVSANQTKHSLISIIRGLQQKEFGLNTLYRIKEDIKTFKSRYIDTTDSTLYVDSGGYSIIQGLVSSRDIQKFVGCYHNYILEEKDIFNYIFSLDIPFNLQEPEFNTKNNIYNWNKTSLTESKKILEQYPELQQKFYLTFHFKMLKQYEIFKQLYKELDYNNIQCQFALGGMVSLRGIVSDMDFSPFMVPAYNCFNYYIQRQRFEYPFKLHTLGIYPRYDRFALIVLEKLFNSYLKEYRSSALVSHDTINYEKTAYLRVKELEIYNFTLGQTELIKYDNIQKVDKQLLQQVYYTPDLYLAVLDELKNLQNKKNLTNIAAFAPLNIYSNLELDKYFEHMIDKYTLIDRYTTSKNYSNFENKLKPVLGQYKQDNPDIFTNRFINSINKNLRIIYKCHNWWVNDKSEKTLDELMRQFIKMINFPADLS